MDYQLSTQVKIDNHAKPVTKNDEIQQKRAEKMHQACESETNRESTEVIDSLYHLEINTCETNVPDSWEELVTMSDDGTNASYSNEFLVKKTVEIQHKEPPKEEVNIQQKTVQDENKHKGIDVAGHKFLAVFEKIVERDCSKTTNDATIEAVKNKGTNDTVNNILEQKIDKKPTLNQKESVENSNTGVTYSSLEIKSVRKALKESHGLVVYKLEKIVDLELQMSILVEMLTLSDQDIKNRMDKAQEIQNIVSKYHPKVYLFGSTVSGLGFKGCDIDAYMDIEGVKAPFEKVYQILKEKEKNDLQQKIVAVTAIRCARVPIIKFVIDGYAVDLSLGVNRSCLGVMNSKLIQTFINYNPSIRPLMVLIRYWASFYELSGAANRPKKITNFALSMLLIFYLQIHSILPSVESLQENLKEEDSFIIHSVQCGYPKNVFEWPKLKGNGKSMIWLLHNFFKFYAIFDYENQIICPYSGKFNKKKLSKTNLYVGDPFDPVLNLTSGYTYSALTKWKEYCIETAKITEKFLESGLQQVEQNRGILDIFEIPPVKTGSKKHQKTIPKRPVPQNTTAMYFPYEYGKYVHCYFCNATLQAQFLDVHLGTSFHRNSMHLYFTRITRYGFLSNLRSLR